MEKLINDCELFQKERPTKITNKQRLEVLTEVAENVLEWGISKDSIATIISDLDNVSTSNDSGYEMAKELEDSFYCFGSYDINSNFIELLESIDSLIGDKKRENTSEWVKAHNIKPKFKKGDGFILKTSPSRGFDIGEKVFITMINSQNAYYCINKLENGNGGRVIVFEKLESCV
tara:strand:+ start:8 stop:532 length:525 start_codon:yes stop_codon:yes gene_type:complete